VKRFMIEEWPLPEASSATTQQCYRVDTRDKRGHPRGWLAAA
jgi:hypothetical protein